MAKRSFKEFIATVGSKIPKIASDVADILISPNPIAMGVKKVGELLSDISNKEPDNEEIKQIVEEFNQSKADWELEMEKLDIERKKLEVEDKASARSMYIQNGQKQADLIGNNIMRMNLFFIFALLFVQMLVTLFSGHIIKAYVLDETLAINLSTTIGSIAGTAIGTVVGSLLQERGQVVGFYFGSSFGSQKKDMIKT